MDALLIEFVQTLGSFKPDVPEKYLFGNPDIRVLSRNHPYLYGVSFTVETNFEYDLAAQNWDFYGIINNYIATLQIPTFPQGMCYSVTAKAYYWLGQKEESQLEVQFNPRHHAAGHTPTWIELVVALQQKQAAGGLPASKETFNSTKTRPAHPTNLLSCQRQEPSMPIIIDNETEWEVEAILDSRRVGRKSQLQYRAAWVGHQADPTWYPAEDFVNSQDLLEEFHSTHPQKPAPKHYPSPSGPSIIAKLLNVNNNFLKDKSLIGPVITSLSVSYTPWDPDWYVHSRAPPSPEDIRSNQHYCALFNFINNLEADQLADHDILNDRHFRYVRQLANSPSSEYGIGANLKVIKNRIKHKGIVDTDKSWMVAASTCEYGGGAMTKQISAQLFTHDVPKGTLSAVSIWELLIFRMKEQLRSYDKHGRLLRMYVEDITPPDSSEEYALTEQSDQLV